MTRREAILLSLNLNLPSMAQVQRSNPPVAGSPTLPSDNSRVEWKPRSIFPGAPVLFVSKSFAGPARWLGREIEFQRAGDNFAALAGIELDRRPGRYPLVLGGETIEIPVTDHAYPISCVTVPQKFVTPPKAAQARIAQERNIKEKVFKASSPQRLWRPPFVAPVQTRYTSTFGARRVYNGTTQSVHQGLDYSAVMGTEVRAANSGRVAIAGDFYFEGGFIVIDHGEAIFTLYMHLSKLLVKKDSMVDAGVPIAFSGSSGRVTGPHLHFAVQWQGSYLEPTTLLSFWRP